jgi:hypothetical protein
MQASASNHLIPIDKRHSPGGNVSLHPLGGAEHKQHPFLTHAGSIYIICVLFVFTWQQLGVKQMLLVLGLYLAFKRMTVSILALQ